jgi:hypothetical protein
MLLGEMPIKRVRGRGSASIRKNDAVASARDRRARPRRHDAAPRHEPADIDGPAIRAGELRGDCGGRAHDEPWPAAAAQGPPFRARSGPAKCRRRRSRRNCRLASDT